MEHYFLCICQDGFTDEEQKLITSYITSLLSSDTLYNYCSLIANHVAALLKPSLAYIAVLSSDQKCDENLMWTELNRECITGHFISSSLGSHVNSETAHKIRGTIQLTAAAINTVADQLPSYGTYKLDVIISYDILKNLTVSEVPELANSFYRLLRWHEAHSAIIVSEESDLNNLQNWCEIMSAEILQKNIDKSLGPVLWRGSIELQVSNALENVLCQALEFRIDLAENDDNLSCYLAMLADENSDAASQCLVLSPVLELIDECSFATIPSYMLSPVICQICKREPSILNENSSRLLQYLSNKEGAALILRMGFALSSQKMKPEKSLSTSKWQKAISSGYIKRPDTPIEKFDDYITFAVTRSQKSASVIAYPFRDPKSLNVEFYFNIVNMRNMNHNCCSDQSDEVEGYANILKQLPYVDKSAFSLVIKKVKKLKTYLHKNCKKDDVIFGVDKRLSISTLIKASEKRLECSEVFEDIGNLSMICEEIDPSDWSERVHLLRQQIKIDEEKSYASNMFMGLGPKLSQDSVSLSSEDVIKYFQSTGEAKVPTNDTICSLKDMKMYVKNDFNLVFQENWPVVLHCIYDDIYYNLNNQSEEKEAVGNQMVQLYVQHETACTCNKQQLIPDSSITIKVKKVTSDQKNWRSPTFRRQANIREKIKERFNLEKDDSTSIINKSSFPVSRRKSLNNSSFKEALGKRIDKNVSKRTSAKRKLRPVRHSPRKKDFSAPVRTSPRKKVAVNYHYSALSKKSIQSTSCKVNKTQELPELMKKKLRVAVASALESHGINLNDAFFRPCGKRLFAICQAFVQDISNKKGSTSQRMQKIADAHVKQVIEFERQRENGH